MKTTLALIAFTLLIPVGARAQDGKLNLSFLDRLAERASEKQEITIDSSMLSSARSFVPPNADAKTAAKNPIDISGFGVCCRKRLRKTFTTIREHRPGGAEREEY